MQDAMEPTVRRLARVAATVLTLLVACGATATGASAAEVCGTLGPHVCVNVSGTPSSVSPSRSADLPSFISYVVTIRNDAPNTVTHVTLHDAITGGALAPPATPSTGTCVSGAAVVDCVLGSLASGASVTVTIVAKAPVAGLAALPSSVANTATARFDEGVNDANTAAKQDTVTASETTIVEAQAGSAASFVPSGAEVVIDTDPTLKDSASPTDPNIGKARVRPSPHPAITASLDEVTAPFVCPKKVICRAGAWVHADIGNGLEFTPALEFELHWSKVLASRQQTTKNLAVLHTDCIVSCPPGTVPEVVSRRCTSADPPPAELPCLSGVAETATEFRATLHSRTNGYMR
jgi:hypothetical protein